MIRYPRTPSNVYSYNPTIFGFPIREVLITAALLCLSILASEINAYVSLILFLAILTAILQKKNSKKSSLMLKVHNFRSKKEKMYRMTNTFHNFNGLSFVFNGQAVASYFEVLGMDIISMRENVQHLIFNEIRSALDACGLNLDFYSAPFPEKYSDRNSLTFRTFMRFSFVTKVEEREAKLLSLSQEMLRFVNRLESVGFVIRKITDREELNSLISDLLKVNQNQIPVKKRGGLKEVHKLVNYKRHGRYLETNSFSSDLLLVDCDYNSGPFYQTFLESTGIPVVLHTSVRKAGGSNPGKFLKSLIAERKAELRIAGTNTQKNNFLKMQLRDLESMRDRYEEERAQPLNIINSIRVYSTHPAILEDRVQRIKTDLEKIGMQTEELPTSATSIDRLVSTNFQRKHAYLMSSVDVAHIIPIYRDPNKERSGIPLGIDDLSERVTYYDPFRQTSYNAIIIGETGSGKSFFSKLMVMRSIEAKMTRSVFIFDPLNEYFCKHFNSRCTEVYLDEFIYNTGDLEGHSSEKITIIKAQPEDVDEDIKIHKMLTLLNSGMMNNDPSSPKMIVIDECHIILRNNVNNKLLASMVRHSRHYTTSIINISQNTDDFLNDRSGSIALNSNRTFIFRTRNIRENHKKVLKLEGFSYEPPERLMGGSLHPYSECIVSDGDFCRKIRIISGSDEDSKLQS